MRTQKSFKFIRKTLQIKIDSSLNSFSRKCSYREISDTFNRRIMIWENRLFEEVRDLFMHRMISLSFQTVTKFYKRQIKFKMKVWNKNMKRLNKNLKKVKMKNNKIIIIFIKKSRLNSWVLWINLSINLKISWIIMITKWILKTYEIKFMNFFYIL